MNSRTSFTRPSTSKSMSSDSKFGNPAWDPYDSPKGLPPPLLQPDPSPTKTNRPSTSGAIQTAMAQLAQKGMDNAPAPYTVNKMKPASDASPTKGPSSTAHSRMQSLHPTTNKADQSQSYLERRSPERANRASVFEVEPLRTPERSHRKSTLNSLNNRSSSKPPETPTMRPASRQPSRFDKENSPPSSTMPALPNTKPPELSDLPPSLYKPPGLKQPDYKQQDPRSADSTAPSSRFPATDSLVSRPTVDTLSSVTSRDSLNSKVGRSSYENPTPTIPPKTDASAMSTSSANNEQSDALSGAIQSLTKIATGLQTELTSLSRRSKDNATDLLSLKDAANARDEDIRRSLKELSAALTSKLQDTTQANAPNPQGTPSPRKNFPRSPGSLGLDIPMSPSLQSDGGASIALLEKVLREMATKEGIETLSKRVDSGKSKPFSGTQQQSDKAMLKMLEEILEVVKRDSTRLTVKDNDVSSLPRPSSFSPTNRSNVSTPRGKPSYSELSTTSAKPDEVKDLVLELRNGVTEMSKDMAKKLEAMQKDSQTTGGEALVNAINKGLDDVRSHLENVMQKNSRSTPDDTQSQVTEMLKSLALLREDVKLAMVPPKESGEPQNLAALQEMLHQMQMTIAAIYESQRKLEQAEESKGRELVLASESAEVPEKAVTLESLAELITSLQQNVSSLEEHGASRRDIESLTDNYLKQVRRNVGDVTDFLEHAKLAKQKHVDTVLTAVFELTRQQEDLASKNNVMILENLLEDIKIQTIDGVSVNQFKSLETMTGNIKTILENVANKQAELSEKEKKGENEEEQENLVKEIWVMVEELKSSVEEVQSSQTKQSGQSFSKEDGEKIETLISEIKSQIESKETPDLSTLPSKTEFADLHTLVAEFRDRTKTDNEHTTEAFETQIENNERIDNKIETTQTMLRDAKDELIAKILSSDEGFASLRNILGALAMRSESLAEARSIEALTNLVTDEFSLIRQKHGASQKELEEVLNSKQDEARATLVTDVGAKISEQFGDLVAKYQELRALVGEKFESSEQRDAAHLQHLQSDSNKSDELKTAIDLIGAGLGEIRETFGGDAKPLISRAESTFTKIDEMFSDLKVQNDLIVGEFAKSATTNDRIEKEITTSNPEIYRTVQQIQEHAGHHLELSRETKNELAQVLEKISDLSAPPPPPHQDDALRQKLDDLADYMKALPSPSNDNSEVLSKLEDVVSKVGMLATSEHIQDKFSSLLEEYKTQLQEQRQEQEQNKDQEQEHQKPYDDSAIREQLNEILEHASSTRQTVGQMEKLDQIQEQVAATQRELSEIMAGKNRLITGGDEAEDDRKEAKETEIDIRQLTSRKERMEEEIVELDEEKRKLSKEKEELSKSKAKLNREVSALEMALRIRREEMQLMEDRAEGLERRVVEGVLDHARSILLNRGAGLSAMNLKRVSSGVSSQAPSTAPGSAKLDGNFLNSSLSIAMKRRGPPKPSGGNLGKDRRIMSLSGMGPNARAPSIPKYNGLKRSQNIKTALGNRNVSLDESALSSVGREDQRGRSPDYDRTDTSLSEISDADTERYIPSTTTTDTSFYRRSSASSGTASTDRGYTSFDDDDGNMTDASRGRRYAKTPHSDCDSRVTSGSTVTTSNAS